MTVDELMDMLKQFPPEMQVGLVGEYEVEPMPEPYIQEVDDIDDDSRPTFNMVLFDSRG